jgi:hypothetical protein
VTTFDPDSNGDTPIKVVFSEPESGLFKASVTIHFDMHHNDLIELREEVASALFSMFGDPGPVKMVFDDDH